MTAIEVRGVSKKFRRHRPRPGRAAAVDAFWALRGVDLQVERGTMLGIIGRNGSGKSTLLKVISRILTPDAGTVTVHGRVAALIELGAGFHPELTGRENLIINGIVLGLTRSETAARLDAIVDFAEVREFIDAPVRTYSSGMYARLAFSVGVHVDPDILLVDEVLAIGDKAFKQKCLDRIADLKRRGKTIVLVSHDLGLVRSWCDEAVWLNAGAVQASGGPADVIAAYVADDPAPGRATVAAARLEPQAPRPLVRDETALETVADASSLVDVVLRAIGPTRVLDIGPVAGSLVTALRDRGVEAVGRDIASTASLPGDEYDLVICRELRLHLDETATRRTIAAACRGAADVLVLVGPEALADSAAVDPPLPSFWVDVFGEHGFALDLDFAPGSTFFPVMRFRRGKTDGTLVDALLARRARLHARLAAYYWRVRQQDDLIAGLRFQLRSTREALGWKVLERLRRLRDRVMPADTRRRRAYWLSHRTLETFLDEGPAAVWRKTRHKIHLAAGGGRLGGPPAHDVAHDVDRQYEEWTRRHELTGPVIEQMSAAVAAFAYAPSVSIVITVHDTDERRLRGAIESVRAQTYPDWELCLVDDASTAPGVRQVLDEYAALDRRIRVTRLALPAGSASAGNAAIEMAAGEFIGRLHADDELSADAIFEVVKRLNECAELDLVYSDEDTLELDGRRVDPFFKPDWSPDLLLSCNYVHRLGIFRRRCLLEVGGLGTGLSGGDDYDLVLRLTERTRRIAHVPKVLYHARKTPGSAEASASSRRALEAALRRRGIAGWVDPAPGSGLHTVRYRVVGTPLVSIIIPTRDQGELLQQCVHSIEERTGYPRYEIIVIDNGSVEPATVKYLDALGGRWEVHRYAAPFNFAAINNFGVGKAKGEYLLFLNDDTQAIGSEWLSAMLEHAQRPGVGAVGAKLLYPHGRLQHAGVVLGIGGVAGHALRHLPDTTRRPLRLADCVRNCSAVTAACMMVPRAVFDEVQGFDERFRVAYNDVDLCLRIRERGYVIVYSPLTALYHHESASRGRLHPPEDEALCLRRWGSVIRSGDPYYNPNLTLEREDWSLRL